jgi:hypothetical protein
MVKNGVNNATKENNINDKIKEASIVAEADTPALLLLKVEGSVWEVFFLFVILVKKQKGMCIHLQSLPFHLSLISIRNFCTECIVIHVS